MENLTIANKQNTLAMTGRNRTVRHHEDCLLTFGIDIG